MTKEAIVILKFKSHANQYMVVRIAHLFGQSLPRRGPCRGRRAILFACCMVVMVRSQTVAAEVRYCRLGRAAVWAAAPGRRAPPLLIDRSDPDPPARRHTPAATRAGPSGFNNSNPAPPHPASRAGSTTPTQPRRGPSAEWVQQLQPSPALSKWPV